GFVGLHTGQEGHADKREVANQVESFVASKLIGKSQRAIHDAVFRQHNSILKRAAADQAHLPEWCDVTFEAEGSRTRQEVAKCLRIDGYFNLLLTDQRMPKVDVASHAKLVRGIDAYAAIAFYHFERLQDSQETALAPKAANSAMVEQLHERLG